jgi:hypothetical protein
MAWHCSTATHTRTHSADQAKAEPKAKAKVDDKQSAEIASRLSTP